MNDTEIKPWAVLSWPNRISLMRLLLVAPFIVLLMNQQQWGPSARYGALAIFIVMAVSDAIDGMLARRLNQITRLGAILDPLADKVLVICSVVLLSLDRETMSELLKVRAKGTEIMVVVVDNHGAGSRENSASWLPRMLDLYDNAGVNVVMMTPNDDIQSVLSHNLRPRKQVRL